MNIEMRAMTPAEKKYSYKQSSQISMQTSFVGYLCEDIEKDGKELSFTWNAFLEKLNTPEFKSEFDNLINMLRDRNGILNDYQTFCNFCQSNRECAFCNEADEYGVRIDTEKYAYMLRMNSMHEAYSFCCYCYEKRWLDHHLSEAERGIRFITPEYKTLFIIPDGDKIRITEKNGTSRDYVCRYIDQSHVEIEEGWNHIYHICQFAEIIEQNGDDVIPLRSSLPEQCYVYLPTTHEIGIVKKGENGYYHSDILAGYGQNGKVFVDELNRLSGISKAKAEAMSAGSMFGWGCPAADPQNYDENGKLKNYQKNRDYAR